MPLEYRVVSADTLTKDLGLWPTPAARAREYAASLQDALNRMANEGWRLVESHKEPCSGAVYFIFEREPPQEPRGDFRDAIQAVRPST
jgi:hypothetical protein